MAKELEVIYSGPVRRMVTRSMTRQHKMDVSNDEVQVKLEEGETPVTTTRGGRKTTKKSAAVTKKPTPKKVAKPSRARSMPARATVAASPPEEPKSRKRVRKDTTPAVESNTPEPTAVAAVAKKPRVAKANVPVAKAKTAVATRKSARVKRERLSSAEGGGSNTVGSNRSSRRAVTFRVKVEEPEPSENESVVSVREGDPEVEYLLDSVYMLVVHCSEMENSESQGPATGSRWSDKFRSQFLESLASRAVNYEVKDLSNPHTAFEGQTEKMASNHMEEVQEAVEESYKQKPDVVLVGFGVSCVTNLFALGCCDGLEEKVACVVHIAPPADCVQMVNQSHPESPLFNLSCPMLFVTGGEGTGPVRSLAKKMRCPSKHLVIKDTNENLYGPSGRGVNMEEVSERIVAEIVSRVVRMQNQEGGGM